MTGPEIVVMPTGTANTASVLAAFERLGARPRLCAEPAAVAGASFVVLPGVGAYAAAVERLDAAELRGPLRDRIAAGRPTLAICLGLQLLGRSSEESPGASGLGVVPATARRFPAGPRVPHLGWNRVEPAGSELIEAGDAYFAHTFRVEALPAGWCGATTDYAGCFASAFERGPVLACQFHPELSGAWGAGLLARWLERGREVSAC